MSTFGLMFRNDQILWEEYDFYRSYNIEDLKNLENLFRKELLDREFIITNDLIKSRMFKYKIL